MRSKVGKIGTFCSKHKEILVIFILALVLRQVGTTHGFPFITHPDEPSVVRSALGIRFYANPGHFDWPHLYFYLNFFIYTGFIAFRGFLQVANLRATLEPAFPLLWQDPLVFYFISRVLTGLFSALTVIPVYMSAKLLFGRRAAIFGTMTFSIIPYHIWHSHYALIDAPMLFFMAWGLYFSARILLFGSLKNYVFAGFFAGLAASTKYNGYLIVVSILTAHLLKIYFSRDEKLFRTKGLRNLFIAGIASLVGFFVGTPYAFIDFKTFIRSDSPAGALWQFKNVGKVDFITQIIQFFDNFIYRLSDDFGYTFLLVYGVFILWAVYSVVKRKKYAKNRSMLFVLIPSLLMFWYVAGFEKPRSHYYFIVYPFVALAVGYIAGHIMDHLFAKSLNWSKLSLFTVMLIFIVPMLFSLKNATILLRKDTLNILYDWLLERVEPEDLIVYDGTELEPVLEKFDENIIVSASNYSLDKYPPRIFEGYIIISWNAKDPIEPKLNNRNDFSTLVKGLPIHRGIGPRMMTGPIISIFGF